MRSCIMKKVISLSLLFCILTVSLVNGAEREFPITFFEDRFLRGMRTFNEDLVVGVLVSDHPNAVMFVANNSLAGKLYGILMSTSAGENFENEAKQTPFEQIAYMAKKMATIGGNAAFLANIGQ